MEDINVTIHQQLKEYAQRLFTATVNAYTTDGKCSLKPGKYSAKEMQHENFMKIHEINTGHALTPEEINEEITVTAGKFSATFMYRDIFVILARWEAMMKPGKDKSVFEIGDIEIISAKVLTDEKTELGTYKEKRMKLQRLHGNWYAPARIKNNVYSVNIYYKHNNVVFCGGQMPVNSLVESNRENLIRRLDKVENVLTKSLLDLAERNEYFAEVCKRIGIEAQQPATSAETPQISTGSVEAANVSAESEKREVLKPMSETTCAERPTLDDHDYYTWLMMAEDKPRLIIAERALNEALTNIAFAEYRGSGQSVTIHYHGGLVDAVSFPQLTPEPVGISDNLPKPPKFAPQPRYTFSVGKCIIQTIKRTQRANKRTNSAVRRFRTTQNILCSSTNWSAANSPPIGSN